MKMKTGFLLVAMASAVTAQAAAAHPGHGTEMVHEQSFILAGALHVLSGADHMVAALALGIWAAVAGKHRWTAPLSFIGAMIIGGLAARAGFEVALVEPMVIAGTLCLVILALARMNTPSWGAALLAGAFGASHGYAHMAEFASQSTSASLAYAFGALAVTALVATTGLLIARAMRLSPGSTR